MERRASAVRHAGALLRSMKGFPSACQNPAGRSHAHGRTSFEARCRTLVFVWNNALKLCSKRAEPVRVTV